jgi:hypothetical protein
MDMRMVRVTNRTSRPIEIMVDGQARLFKPGDDNWYPAYVAVKAIERAPMMGSENPELENDMVYLLGVAAWGNDVSPIEPPEPDDPRSFERFDRSQLDPKRHVVVRGIPAGLRARVDAETGKGPRPGLRNIATPAVRGQGGENLSATRFSDPSDSTAE